MSTKTTEVTFGQLHSATLSIQGRLARLKSKGWRGKSPIAEIGVFSEEIDIMEETLLKMRNKISSAKVTIEIQGKILGCKRSAQKDLLELV